MSNVKKFYKFVNEDYSPMMNQPEVSPVTKPAEPVTVPDTPTRPRPSRPGITPTERPSVEDAPLAKDIEYDKLSLIADELGLEVEFDHVVYKGYFILYDESKDVYEVNGKEYKEPRDVIRYLNSL